MQSRSIVAVKKVSGGSRSVRERFCRTDWGAQPTGPPNTERRGPSPLTLPVQFRIGGSGGLGPPVRPTTIRIYSLRNLLILVLRHEETCQSARSRQHRSMIVDKQIDFFWLIVSMGHSLGRQIEPVGRPGPHKAAKSTQQGCQEQADRAISGQIDPARAPGAARSRQLRPDRASQGVTERRQPVVGARKSQSRADRATKDAPSHLRSAGSLRESQLDKLASSTSLVEHFRYG